MSHKKVLIIDDEPDVVVYLSAVLESNGYKSYSANDIQYAMQLVKEVHPDLICLDIMIPKETGISFYVKLRKEKEFKNIPVIIISGIIETDKFNFRSFVKDVSIQPPECFMDKPIDVEKYIQKINELTHS